MSDKTDMVIGVASGYGWDEVAAWALSLVRSGFEGVGAVIVYDGEDKADALTGSLRSLGMRVIRMPLSGSVYNQRFEDISRVLRACLPALRFAVVTDVRDVYFQSDPTVWLENHLTKPFLAVSEAIRYADEEWNENNLRAGFPLQVDRLLPKTVYNVGVLAGEAEAITDLCLAISLTSKSSTVSPADQSAYNLLLDMEPYRSTVQLTASRDGFTCQAGTLADPRFRSVIMEREPILDSAGVKTPDGALYPIVHQYDRIPEWSKALLGKLSERSVAVSRLDQVMPDAGAVPDGTPTPKVTLVCPTYRRAAFLRQAVENYRAQEFDGTLEMVILDDSPEPSDFLDSPEYREQGVRYYHLPDKRLSMGAKINLLTQLARGEIIMVFDDDDYYAPQYVERMTEFLGDADFLTLSRWYAYDPARKSFCYWSTDIMSPTHFVLSPWEPITPVSTHDWDTRSIEGNLWGYGFSFVWRKSVHVDVEIPDTPAEGLLWDLDFSRRLQQAGFKTLSVPDLEGLVLHIIHSGNSTRIFPQHTMPEFMMSKFFPLYTSAQD